VVYATIGISIPQPTFCRWAWRFSLEPTSCDCTKKLRRDTLDVKPAEFESVSDGPIPKEHRTMKQESGRRQPRIPVLQGGEDVKGVVRARGADKNLSGQVPGTSTKHLRWAAVNLNTWSRFTARPASYRINQAESRRRESIKSCRPLCSAIWRAITRCSRQPSIRPLPESLPWSSRPDSPIRTTRLFVQQKP
jgi:hypothetical protein